MKNVLTLLLLIASWQANAFELVIIQSISSSKKSFVTRTGKEVGIHVGQKATFTSKKVSLIAQATAVNKDFTVWQVKDPKAIIPFNKNQVIEYNNSLDSIYTNLRVYQDQIARQAPKERFVNLRISSASSLNESISSVDADVNQALRTSIQYELTYQTKFAKYLYGGVGARVDGELTRGSNFEVVTTRYIGLVDLELLLPRFKNLNTMFYLGLGAGFGYSQSEILGAVSNGPVRVLPFVRTGFRTPIAKTGFSFLLEGGVESLHADESFADGVEQTTDLTNSKLSLGLVYQL